MFLIKADSSVTLVIKNDKKSFLNHPCLLFLFLSFVQSEDDPCCLKKRKVDSSFVDAKNLVVPLFPLQQNRTGLFNFYFKLAAWYLYVSFKPFLFLFLFFLVV